MTLKILAVLLNRKEDYNNFQHFKFFYSIYPELYQVITKIIFLSSRKKQTNKKTTPKLEILFLLNL